MIGTYGSHPMIKGLQASHEHALFPKSLCDQLDFQEDNQAYHDMLAIRERGFASQRHRVRRYISQNGGIFLPLIETSDEHTE